MTLRKEFATYELPGQSAEAPTSRPASSVGSDRPDEFLLDVSTVEARATASVDQQENEHRAGHHNRQVADLFHQKRQRS